MPHLLCTCKPDLRHRHHAHTAVADCQIGGSCNVPPPPLAAVLWSSQASVTVVLQIHLLGKAQQQHMDRRWYTALRQVKVLGRRLDPAEIRQLQLQGPARQQADW